MKKNYSKILFIVLFALGLKANAQCSSCTITISGADASSHTVASGTTLCITPSGNATGLITVSSGGTLCNQGTINSTNLWVAGGVFNNYGTINTNKVLTSVAGTFNNYGTAIIDSLLITQSGSMYNNQGIDSNLYFSVSSNAQTMNTGTMKTNYMGDSVGTYINNGNLTVNIDFGNAYTSIFTNNKNMTVTRDFYNSYSSTFTNNNYLKISRTFYNSTSSTLTTKCMVTVAQDWYNSATVLGPSTGSCGGFNIAGVSANSGTIGSSSTHIDLCDAGHPSTGIDGPGGTIATTTTYCSCTNSCVMVGIIEPIAQSSVLIQNIYPNPATASMTIDLQNKEPEQLIVEVMDMLGRKYLTTTLKTTVGENKTTIDVTSLAQGMYILKITDSHQLQVTKLFNISK